MFIALDEAQRCMLLIAFLRRLTKDGEQKVFLIVDNLKVHHAKRVKAWLASQ
ncbi:MAG TPA: transposase, partial [Geminicoccaceae bacterium]